jgi:uncharacterized protein (TIGR02722 family)
MNINRNSILNILIMSATIIGASGCATNKPAFSSGNVAYGDTAVQENLTNEFSSNDYSTVAKIMADSLKTSAFIKGSKGVPRITISDLKNKTSEHIDTQQIMEELKSLLQEAGTVTFATSAADDSGSLSELQRQNQSGLYKQSQTAKIGNRNAAKYRLHGDVTSIVKKAGDIKNIDYIINMRLENIEEGSDEWSKNYKIRKTSERSTF